jgi:hypothetical protein
MKYRPNSFIINVFIAVRRKEAKAWRPSMCPAVTGSSTISVVVFAGTWRCYLVQLKEMTGCYNLES